MDNNLDFSGLTKYVKKSGECLSEFEVDSLDRRSIKLLYGITGIPDGVFEDNWKNRQMLIDLGIVCPSYTFDEFKSVCFEFRDYLIVPAGMEPEVCMYLGMLKRYTNYRGFLVQDYGCGKFIFGANRKVAEGLIRSGLDDLALHVSIPSVEYLDLFDFKPLVIPEIEVGFGMGYVPAYDSRYTVGDPVLGFMESSGCLMEFGYNGPWLKIAASVKGNSILEDLCLLNPSFCRNMRILSPDERRNVLYKLGKDDGDKSNDSDFERLNLFATV